jgi:sugar phosphate isomerase/epimerase
VIQLGIFAKTFARPTLGAVLDAIQAHGLRCIQFNMACVGLPTLPDEVNGRVCDYIVNELAEREITMGAISGTFNMIDPDLERRRAGFRRLRVLARVCRRLGTSVITLCTGTRDPESMWRWHPDNHSAQAWEDLLVSMKAAVSIANETGVILAFEPEISNVVDSATKARCLLDGLSSPLLKVAMDAANLAHAGEASRMHSALDEAFKLLGWDIVVAHAKDLSRDGQAGHSAAGTGMLDYDHYIALLQAVGFEGPLILHSLAEAEVPQSVAFLRRKLMRAALVKGNSEEALAC